MLLPKATRLTLSVLEDVLPPPPPPPPPSTPNSLLIIKVTMAKDNKIMSQAYMSQTEFILLKLIYQFLLNHWM